MWMQSFKSTSVENTHQKHRSTDPFSSGLNVQLIENFWVLVKGPKLSYKKETIVLFTIDPYYRNSNSVIRPQEVEVARGLGLLGFGV